MKLFLLRHAEAEDRSPDARRALTERGRQSIIDLAHFVKDRLPLDVEAIWHSPLLRAIETASLFRETLGLKAPLLERPGLCPMDHPIKIIDPIEAQNGNILLVGHNPHFEALTASLLGLDPGNIPVNVPKASLLRFKRYGNSWQLRELLTTKVTRR